MDCYCDYEDEDEASSFLSYCNHNACPSYCKESYDCEDGGEGGQCSYVYAFYDWSTDTHLAF